MLAKLRYITQDKAVQTVPSKRPWEYNLWEETEMALSAQVGKVPFCLLVQNRADSIPCPAPYKTVRLEKYRLVGLPTSFGDC